MNERDELHDIRVELIRLREVLSDINSKLDRLKLLEEDGVSKDFLEYGPMKKHEDISDEEQQRLNEEVGNMLKEALLERVYNLNLNKTLGISKTEGEE